MTSLEHIGIAATPSNQVVVANAAVEDIITVVTHQYVVTSPPGQPIVTTQTVNVVIARQRIEGIAGRGAEYEVIT